jgi:hypothetical protein
MMNMGNADTLQISIVVELVTVAVTLLLTVITVFSLYRKALNDTKNRIDDFEKSNEARFVSLENQQKLIIDKLSYEESQRNFVIATSRSTQSWNEKKMCSHLKLEFEVIDLIIRKFNDFDDPDGILDYKRYNIVNLLLKIINQNYSIGEELATIIDCRRTITRIMESIRMNPELSGKLKRPNCLSDYSKLQAATENILFQAENGKTNFHIDNLDDIERMAQ